MSYSGLTLNLLGTPTLLSENRPVSLSPRAALLCAYLALAPRGGRPRAVVAAQLFADCPEGSARRRLNTALWRLQGEVRTGTGVELLGRTENHFVGLHPAVKLRVDAIVFEDLLKPVVRTSVDDLTGTDVARLEGAIGLHHGALIEQCDDEWVLPARQRIEMLYITALDYLIQHNGATGDVAAVGRYGDLAIGLQPLREDIHRHLMAAYAASGRYDLVERQFEQCRMIVLAELGADLMPETVALYGHLSRERGGAEAYVDTLFAELERARRDVVRLGNTVERVLDRLRRMP